jgi:hypothetical protein
VIEQVRGPLGHPAASAARAQRAAFTRERDQPVEAAIGAAQPRKPAGEPATRQEVPERLLDEARRAFPVAHRGGLRTEGFEVIVHDLVERTLGWRPRLVGR